MRVSRSLEDVPRSRSRRVATIGNFDGMHLGHQQLTQGLVARAREVSGTAAVITFHPHPLQVLAPNNAPRQIQTLDQKLSTLERLGVDLVIVIPFTMELAQTNARDFAIGILWERLSINEIYVGPNFAFGHRREGSFNLLKEIGEEKGFQVGKISQVQFRGSRVSSTAVRQSLIAGQANLARRLLGRPYSLVGEVVLGSSRGVGLGFPTANQNISNELIPRKGVYATLLTVDGKRHRGVTNVGVRPTVTPGPASATLTVETHILEFQEDIYGKTVVLEFLTRLRDEHKFPGKDALVAQIKKDVMRARRYFRWLEAACLKISL